MNPVNERRRVPDGVSVFDLIMPWKAEVKQNLSDSLVQNGLAKIVTNKSKVVEEDFSKHANDVQAILVNPPWDSISGMAPSKLPKNRLTIDDFTKHFKISTDVMKDGLVFIWIEKEYISEIIKCLEAQDFFYVENVCYVMLNQNKKEGKYHSIII